MYGHTKINLMALPGAEYLRVNLKKLGAQDCICIPVQYCDAYPFQTRDGQMMAHICVNLNGLDQKYIQSAIESAAKDGKQNYTPPCMDMKLAYIGDRAKKMEERLKARAEQVLTQQNPQLTGDALKYAVRDKVNVRLGNVTLIGVNMAAPAAEAVDAAPVPMFDPNNTEQLGASMMPAPGQPAAPSGEAATDDLPF